MASVLFVFGFSTMVTVLVVGLSAKDVKNVFIAAPFMLFVAAAVAKYIGI